MLIINVKYNPSEQVKKQEQPPCHSVVEASVFSVNGANILGLLPNP